MTEQFNLITKPFSINQMYYGDGRNKTQKAREWSYKIFHALNSEENQEKLKNLRDHFKILDHVYHVEIDFQFPKKMLVKKDGSISAKSQDITNMEKTIIDLFFLPKYFEKSSPYGVKNLNVDDKYLTQCLSKKTLSDSDEYKITLRLEILPSPFSISHPLHP